MRKTGPSEETRMIALTRSGFRCELCAGPMDSMSLHHRSPRQMGGSKVPWINNPENLLAICGSGTTGCHGMVESNRSESYDTGRLVRTGFLPWEVPFMDVFGQWWFLNDTEKHVLTLPFTSPVQ